MALRRIEAPYTRRVYTALGETGHVNLTDSGSFYQGLAPGYYRITAVATVRGTVHITNSTSSSARYISQELNEQGSTTVEVTVPKGQEHYLNVWLSDQGDVRVAVEHLAAP